MAIENVEAARSAEIERTPDKASALYRALRLLVRTSLRLFYGRIEVTGLEHLDPTRPTVIVCNHPNSIVDPLLLGTFEPRQVAFCARDGLFAIPVFGRVLRSVGAIPIQRRSDQGADTAQVDNDGAFRAASDVLLAGGVMAIFPEGKTHGRLRIEPVKTGAARIALGALAERPDLPLRVVPVGITYLVRHAFRSDVHVAFGPPIPVLDVAVGENEKDRVRALTAVIGESLRELAVHISQTEDERLIAQVTAIVAGIRSGEGLDLGGQSPAERTALVRRVIDAYRWLSERDPARTASLRARLDDYIEEREALGLGGEKAALQHRGERRFALSGRGRAAFLVAGLPLALFGFLTSLVPYVALRVIMRLLPVTNDRIALFKLLAGAVLFGAAYAGEAWLVAASFGALAAVLFGLALVPASLFARRYVIETRLHRLQLRSLRAFREQRRLSALKRERAELAAELAELRESYLAAKS